VTNAVLATLRDIANAGTTDVRVQTYLQAVNGWDPDQYRDTFITFIVTARVYRVGLGPIGERMEVSARTEKELITKLDRLSKQVRQTVAQGEAMGKQRRPVLRKAKKLRRRVRV
jgi:hypothetical protein